MNSKSKAKVAGLVAAVLFVIQGLFGTNVILPEWRQNYAPKGNIAESSGLSPDQLLFALSGFREMIAGILWVRCDSFFDDGNYDAMLPLIRLTTLLDPTQIDVFSVGMWHIAYNFTDEESRSDRRYIPAALALGGEGIKNNPNTYEMYFETGWLWFNKIDDNYDKAVGLFEQANAQQDIQQMRRNLLAAAYQRNGQIDKALDHWLHLYDMAAAAYKQTGEFQEYQNRNTIENNLDTLLVRMAQRGYFAQKAGRDTKDYDINPPFDVGFGAQVTVPQERVLKIDVNWNVLPVGTRIRVVLRDANFPHASRGAMDWDAEKSVTLDPPKDETWMQDTVYIRNRHGVKKIDMGRDPTMYPFTADKYVLEFYWNPRSGAAFMQDKMGWNGEGMTDKNFLNTDIRKGQRVIFWSTEVTKDQILRLGEWQDKVPVFKTSNWTNKDDAMKTDDVILVPSLRSGDSGQAAAPASKQAPAAKPAAKKAS